MQQVSITYKINPPDPKDPVTIFNVGQAFYLAGHRCALSISVGPGVEQRFPGPAVTNFCFSMELLLKALLFSTGKKIPKNHKLKQLFERIDKDSREEIRKMYESEIQDPTLNDSLSEISDYFVQIRYEHEFDFFCFYDYHIKTLSECIYKYCAKHVDSQCKVESINL